ncbi:DUF3105 domain-containing protein [Streptomyces sp. 4N509B]|uniref:DUF3105 domain-containing protein n=1 Tax=Streptomyces sp. 4N509B TaxID=3457413 RepID=UPI003FD22E74
MGSKNTKAKAAERRARIEEMRRAEQARERRARILTITAVVTVVVAILLGGGLLWWSTEEDQRAEEEARTQPVQGEESWDDLGRNHVEGTVDYPMSPPAGGDHSAVWLDCNATVYDEPVTNEQAVHGLEHGAVWVTYTDQASEEDLATLRERVENTPYSFMSPYQDQDSPITLTAWGHQLDVDDANDKRVGTFFARYVQGEQTPEPGATCSNPDSL